VAPPAPGSLIPDEEDEDGDFNMDAEISSMTTPQMKAEMAAQLGAGAPLATAQMGMGGASVAQFQALNRNTDDLPRQNEEAAREAGFGDEIDAKKAADEKAAQIRSEQMEADRKAREVARIRENAELPPTPLQSPTSSQGQGGGEYFRPMTDGEYEAQSEREHVVNTGGVSRNEIITGAPAPVRTSPLPAPTSRAPKVNPPSQQEPTSRAPDGTNLTKEPRINSLTGLPFGWQPGMPVPKESEGAAAASIERMNDADGSNAAYQAKFAPQVGIPAGAMANPIRFETPGQRAAEAALPNPARDRRQAEQRQVADKGRYDSWQSKKNEHDIAQKIAMQYAPDETYQAVKGHADSHYRSGNVMDKVRDNNLMRDRENAMPDSVFQRQKKAQEDAARSKLYGRDRSPAFAGGAVSKPRFASARRSF
jgi:hypothetical protein